MTMSRFLKMGLWSESCFAWFCRHFARKVSGSMESKLSLKGLLGLVGLVVAIGWSSEASAQRRTSSSAVPAGECECRQVRTVTGQADGTASVCKFDAFNPGNGKNWFDGGWYLTSDLVRFECRGGVAGSGSITYGSQPSPLCKITSRTEEIPAAGRCVHQADTNYDGTRSSDENRVWEEFHKPVVEGAFAGKAAKGAIDLWDHTFALLVSGSDLCDRSRTSAEIAECRQKPVECRRLDAVRKINPRFAEQIRVGFSGYSNSLDHCE